MRLERKNEMRSRPVNAPPLTYTLTYCSCQYCTYCVPRPYQLQRGLLSVDTESDRSMLELVGFGNETTVGIYIKY